MDRAARSVHMGVPQVEMLREIRRRAIKEFHIEVRLQPHAPSSSDAPSPVAAPHRPPQVHHLWSHLPVRAWHLHAARASPSRATKAAPPRSRLFPLSGTLQQLLFNPLLSRACIQELGKKQEWVSETIFGSMFTSFIIWSFSPFFFRRKRFYTAVLYSRLLMVLCSTCNSVPRSLFFLVFVYARVACSLLCGCFTPLSLFHH